MFPIFAYGYYMMDGNSPGWGWGIGMGFLWLLFFCAVLFLTYRLVRGHDGRSSTGKTPLDIAKDRYARGEISKKEFDQLKKDLSE